MEQIPLEDMLRHMQDVVVIQNNMMRLENLSYKYRLTETRMISSEKKRLQGDVITAFQP